MTEIKRKLYKRKKCNFVAFRDLPTTTAALRIPPRAGDGI